MRDSGNKKDRTPCKSEAEMCQRFIAIVPLEWIVYPETCGFDIVLVRKSDGFQIGIEAKLKLNAKVISQAAEQRSHYHVCDAGPDCRAVLVPDDTSGDMSCLCGHLGLQVIRLQTRYNDKYIEDYFPQRFRAGIGFKDSFSPDLPKEGDYNYIHGNNWYEFCHNSRLTLPDYVPDCEAGHPSPLTLTDWKIKAMKIAITCDKRGFVTRKDFEFFKISMPRWTQFGLAAWLRNMGDGTFQLTERAPNFKAQHPDNYQQIADNYDEWKRDFIDISHETTKRKKAQLVLTDNGQDIR